MSRQVIFSFLWMICFAGFSQVKTDTLRLYYAINETESPFNFQKIDSLVLSLNGRPVKVKIIGFADFLHSDKYNQVLSQKRADVIKSYLLKKTSTTQVNVLSCKGNGEKNSKDNGTKEGEGFQRRVDLVIEPLIITELADKDKPEDNNQKKTQLKEGKKKIEDLSKGESMSIKGLNFEPGRHFMTKQSIPVLFELLKTMQENKTLKIEIQGHVCCTPGDEDGMDYDTHNYKLSENRAKAVYDFLVSKGISADRLSYKGFGHSRPKYPDEATAFEEHANRRVEILVVEK